MRVRSLAVTAATLLAVLTGCSQATTPAGPSVTATTDAPGQDARAGSGATSSAGASGAVAPDPCSLVTKDEAAKALSAPMDGAAIPPASGAGQRSCGYSDSSGKLLTVTVGPGDAAAFDLLKAQTRTLGAVQDLTGVGDSAFVGPGLALARKGTLVVSILIGGLGNGVDVTTQLTALMRTAVGRL